MRENDFLFQHCHFLHDKFLVNDESLQIHECWPGHVEKSEVDCDFYIKSKVHLGDFAHNVGQWIILSYAIVYDETIGCYICGHILLAVKFYVFHSGTLDGFVLSRAINDHKKPFLDK